MAGEWLKLECATPDKPEVFAIAGRMGWDDPDLVVGKLFRVWRWFDQQTTTGNAPSVTPALLDRIACATGFAKAMAGVGWLTIDDCGVSLPNFYRHNGATAKARALTAKRVANHRGGNSQANASGNGPAVTGPLAREEKRRKEKKEEKGMQGEAAPPPASAPAEPASPPGRPAGRRPKGEMVTFDTWLKARLDAGSKAIPPGSPVLDYVDKVGIPREYLYLHWQKFRARYSGTSKRYVDWGRTIDNSVRDNWFKLWWFDGDECALTTAGKQAEREFSEGRP